MTIQSINLLRSARFASSVRSIRRLFRNIDSLSIYLGVLSKTYRFDSRCRNRPKLTGVVIASLSVSREREGLFLFYPVSKKIYHEDAAVDFENIIMPQIKEWYEMQLAKPETAIHGNEQIIIEWADSKHTCHGLRYL
jgi:hypothetical protein